MTKLRLSPEEAPAPLRRSRLLRGGLSEGHTVVCHEAHYGMFEPRMRSPGLFGKGIVRPGMHASGIVKILIANHQ